MSDLGPAGPERDRDAGRATEPRPASPAGAGEPAPAEEAAGADTALWAARATGPAARRRLPRWAGPPACALAIVVCFALPFVLPAGTLSTASVALMMICLAQGWNLLGGYGGYINFGMVVFFGVGVYTCAILNTTAGWSMWACLPAAFVAAAVVAVPIGLATLRLRGAYFAILTLVVTFVVQLAVTNLSFTGGANGLYPTPPDVGALDTQVFYYWVFGALALVATVIAWATQHARLGAALRALREDEDAAIVLGVRTTAVKMAALLVGAGLAGVAGVVYAMQIGYIEPAGTFDVNYSLQVVLICVVGGLGTWQGPVIGGFLMVFLQQWLRVNIPTWHPFGLDLPATSNGIVLGLILVLFALYARRGLMGLVAPVRGRRLEV